MRGLSRRPKPRSTGPAALFPSRLFGLRQWTADFDEDGELRLGGFGNREWRRDGETTWAVCRPSGFAPMPRHPSPAPAGNCTCGLYANHPWAVDRDRWEPDSPIRTLPLSVPGIVEAWGRVHVHAEGFRAQYARPRALVLIGYPPESDLGRLVRRLADAHRADLLEVPSTPALIEACARGGLGLTEARVASLLDGR